MKRIRPLIVLILTVSVTAKGPGRLAITVRLSFDRSNPDDMRGASEIRRRLRTFGDVEVTEDPDADYAVELIVIPLRFGNRIDGYAVSETIVAPYHAVGFRRLMPGFDEATLDAVDSHLKGTIFYIKTATEVGAPSDFDTIIRNMVVNIDSFALEPMRQARKR